MFVLKNNVTCKLLIVLCIHCVLKLNAERRIRRAKILQDIYFKFKGALETTLLELFTAHATTTDTN